MNRSKEALSALLLEVLPPKIGPQAFDLNESKRKRIMKHFEKMHIVVTEKATKRFALRFNWALEDEVDFGKFPLNTPLESVKDWHRKLLLITRVVRKVERQQIGEAKELWQD